jgi:hypothetical protein
MIVPFEAEMARPPILTEEDETTLRNEALEVVPLHSHNPAHAHPYAKKEDESSPGSQTDVESGELAEKHIIVEFDEGESPRDWSKAKKWLVTFSTSSLCLSVALGSALPTGE